MNYNNIEIIIFSSGIRLLLCFHKNKNIRGSIIRGSIKVKKICYMEVSLYKGYTSLLLILGEKRTRRPKNV